MKKVLLFLMLMMASICIAQENFFLQPDATFKTEDGKSYYVLQFDGKTQVELYNMVKVAITKSYVAAKDVISEVPNEILSINCTRDKAVFIDRFMGMEAILGINYVLQFEIKDGKVKVNAPIFVNAISMDHSSTAPFNAKWVESCFADNQTKKQREFAERKHNDINFVVNDLIGNIVAVLLSKSTEEDW